MAQDIIKYPEHETVSVGQKFYSKNEIFYVVFQNDGNFVIYVDLGAGHKMPIWGSGTNGNPGAIMHAQGDGNFVIYNKEYKSIWSTGTGGDSHMKMQGDGNLVVYAEKGGWVSDTVAIGNKIVEEFNIVDVKYSKILRDVGYTGNFRYDLMEGKKKKKQRKPINDLIRKRGEKVVEIVSALVGSNTAHAPTPGDITVRERNRIERDRIEKETRETFDRTEREFEREDRERRMDREDRTA